VLDLIVLGVIQGLTEYLPVSSTAHLLFAEHFLGIRRPGLVLESVLHLGTAVAAVVLFWPDVAGMLRGILRRQRPTADPFVKMAGAIVAATVVTAVLGVAFAAPLERMFESVRGVALQLLVTGALLLWHRERGARLATEATLIDGLAVGVAQAAAIIPGVSRSATTIVMGLALGLRRTEATRLSFLVAIPAIVGASVYGLKDVAEAGRLGYTVWQLSIGFIVAALVGALAIRWLVDFVRRGRLVVFSAYCWVIGIAVLAATR
jgi:undecaprenyl-diphosphatase